jgi:hypothetical protein
MRSNPHNPMTSVPHSGPGDETLRLVASLPAPAGLAERVHEVLHSAPRSGRVLTWLARFRTRIALHHDWVRAAAAAAIVLVVVGGGWGVYSRVEQNQPAKVFVMPEQTPASGAFSGAGAIRTPQTLPGPTVKPPAKKTAASKKQLSAKGNVTLRPGNQSAPDSAVAPKSAPTSSQP